MTSNWLFRVGVAILAVAVLGGIAAGIARGRWDDNPRTVEYRLVDSEGQPVSPGEQPVIVVERDGFRPGAFFPVFPLALLGGALIVAGIFATRDHGRRGPGGGSGDTNFQQPSEGAQR